MGGRYMCGFFPLILNYTIHSIWIYSIAMIKKYTLVGKERPMETTTLDNLEKEEM